MISVDDFTLLEQTMFLAEIRYNLGILEELSKTSSPLMFWLPARICRGKLPAARNSRPPNIKH